MNSSGMTREELIAENERLNAWLSALGNLRRIVGHAGEDDYERLAGEALRGDQLPNALKLYTAPTRQHER